VERAIAKVYRAQKFRAFANASVYTAGDVITDARAGRAIRGRTRAGRLMAHHLWVAREWETLCAVFEAGAPVPEPYAKSADAILMEYVGDESGVAPLLRQARLSAAEARRTLDELLTSIECFLSCDRVHGDLSPYNVLWDGSRLCVIDFPQAVDARSNPNARALLRRDVENVCSWLARRGARADAGRFTDDLWRRYTRGQLS
jgi:RIO kinase 1